MTAQSHQTWRHVCIAMRTSTRPCIRTQQPWQIRVCVGGGVLTNFHPERDCLWKTNSSGFPFLPTWKERAREMKMSYYGARVTTYKKTYKGKVTVHCNLFAVARTVTSNKRGRGTELYTVGRGKEDDSCDSSRHLSDCIRDTLEQFLQPENHMLWSYPDFSDSVYD